MDFRKRDFKQCEIALEMAAARCLEHGQENTHSGRPGQLRPHGQGFPQLGLILQPAAARAIPAKINPTPKSFPADTGSLK